MHPQNYYSLFPPFPRNNDVFVAMSFDERFDSRWENVIKPAFEEQINGVLLNPYRVDMRIISNSILIDILEGIRSSRLILGDITTIGEIGGIAVCNNNVMYEIGIAQAIRLPEEVVLFSSDKYEGDKKIPFDLSQIRVNPYDPDENSEKASKHLRKIIIECLSKIDQNKSLFVKHAAESLDFDCELALGEAMVSPSKTVGQTDNIRRIIAISRLLELGLFTKQPSTIDYSKDELIKNNQVVVEKDAEKRSKYKISVFGEAVMGYRREKFYGFKC